MRHPNTRMFVIQMLLVIVLAATLTRSPALADPARQATAPSSPREVAGTRGPAYDGYGNVVQDAEARFNYLPGPAGYARLQLDADGRVVATHPLPGDPFAGSQFEAAARGKSGPSSPSSVLAECLIQDWKTGIWGTGIGASGLTAFDVDGDGQQEIVLGGGYGFDENRFWYILSYSAAAGTYQQEYLSQEYPSYIRRIVVADVAGAGQYTVYVALSSGQVYVYDAGTRELLDTFSSPFSTLADITLADVDGDGEQEIVTASSSGIVVHHAQTYAIEWQTTSYGSSDVEVANVDGDPAPEIVTTRRVIDGVTHAEEWNYSSGFGAIVQLADVDADNMAEIIAAETWYQINAFDADTQAPKWDIPVDLDIGALRVTDFDADGVQEVVYGDGQWGSVHVIDSLTLEEEWAISNPEHGVTGIAFADADQDGVLEILWGAGWSSTGADYLYVGDTTTHAIEWQSLDVGGPLSALDVGDVDNDGIDEIVMVSFQSESGYSDGIIFVYDAETYELEWQSDPILGGSAWTGVHALELADVDGDDVLEILIGTADVYDGVIMAYDGLSHNLDWRTAGYEGTYFSALAAADVDLDGQVEVIGGQDREHTGAPGVYVRVFDGSSGAHEWRTVNLTYWGGVYDIDTGDFDGDGHPEILFSVTDDHARVYDGVTQSQEWESAFSNTSGVAGFDVDQDGDTEILIGTANGQVYAFDGGTHAQEWSESLSGLSINSLRLTDMDRDDVAELVLTDDDYLLIYDAATRNLLCQSERLGDAVGGGGHLFVGNVNADTRDEIVLGSHFALYVLNSTLLPYSASLQVTPRLAAPGDSLSYTIQLRSFSDDLLSAAVTDTLPVSTTYQAGSLWGSDGTWGLAGDTITWTLALTPQEAVSLSFAVTVDAAVTDGSLISNSAIYSIGVHSDASSVATLIDALPPTSTIVQPAPEEIVSGGVYTVTGTAFDATSGVDHVQVRIQGGEWQSASGTSDWTYAWTLPITEDWFTLDSRAVDRVGHVETPGSSVTVWVDNLFPYLVSTTPAHGGDDVALDTPIEIVFSEAILTDTFDFICQPDIGLGSVDVSADATTLTVTHATFQPGQIYRCLVDQARDRANNGLVPGPAPNPWTFSTLQPVVRFASPVYGVEESSQTATIGVDLDVTPSLTVTVDYATSDGTALAGADYGAVSGTLTFAPGTTSQAFDVPILDDGLDEDDETLSLSLSDPNNGTLRWPISATLTILDDDPVPTIRFSAPAYTVGEGDGPATISATLSAPSGLTVAADYGTGDGTALAGSDYVTASGRLTFTPGITIQTFDVSILDDGLTEGDETLSLSLSDPSNGTLLWSVSATLTIVDDETPFRVYLPLVLRNAGP